MPGEIDLPEQLLIVRTKGTDIIVERCDLCPLGLWHVLTELQLALKEKRYGIFAAAMKQDGE